LEQQNRYIKKIMLTNHIFKFIIVGTDCTTWQQQQWNINIWQQAVFVYASAAIGKVTYAGDEKMAH
jgi:hypothetical protein